MTLSAIKAFVASASSDDQLRQKLHQATGLDDLVSLAESHGHVLSKSALLKAQAEALIASPDHALEGINSWGDALMHCFGASAED